MLKTAREYTVSMAFGSLGDIIDGNHFKLSRDDCFLYVLYYYEFECENPLGSHGGIHKIGVIYASLGYFLTSYCSLENIYIYIYVCYASRFSDFYG